MACAWIPQMCSCTFALSWSRGRWRLADCQADRTLIPIRRQREQVLPPYFSILLNGQLLTYKNDQRTAGVPHKLPLPYFLDVSFAGQVMSFSRNQRTAASSTCSTCCLLGAGEANLENQRVEWAQLISSKFEECDRFRIPSLPISLTC